MYISQITTDFKMQSKLKDLRIQIYSLMFLGSVDINNRLLSGTYGANCSTLYYSKYIF